MDRLARKFDTARTVVPAPILEAVAGAKVGIIAYGSSDFAVQESRDQLLAETGLKTSYLRLRAYPFAPSVEEFIRNHDRIYVVEQNRDGQMLKLLRMDSDPTLAAKIKSVLHYDGLPIDARSVTDLIVAHERAV